MNQMYNSRLMRLSGLALGILVWLANASNPPTGRTGAPFDGSCNDSGCHTGSNPGGFNGTVTIDGMPATVDPNTTYPLIITLTPTAGSPIRGGFQLVAVDGNNVNAGDLTAGNAQSGTEFFGGREYVEHRGAKNFTGGGPASWNFNWKSPLTAGGNTIKFYFIGNFTNGNNNSTGDFPVEAVETYNFNGPPPVTATIISATNVSCFGGNNGNATVEGGGGVAPYTYAWTGGQTGQTAINLTAGTYTVTVTGSSGTGTATASVTITQPPVLNTTASVSGVLTCSNTAVTATAVPSGGTPPYSFVWTNGNTNNPTQLTTPGSHAVTVTDDNGCTKVATVNVTSNLVPPNAVAGPAGAITCTQPIDTLNGTGSSTGGIYSYLWTSSGGGNIVSGATTLFPIVNAAGTYTLQVTNSVNGCTSTSSTTVTSSIQPPTASATGGQITCTNTSVTLTATTNATTPTFSWSGPNGYTSTLQNPVVSATGTYTVVVTNTSNGCSNTATASVAANNTPPTATAAGGLLTCSLTADTLTAGSNASGATYAWSGPNNYTSTLQNPVVNIPGTYTVVVTNPANGCTASATASMAQNVTPPTATATAGQITCANAVAQLSASTNAPAATFAWSGPGGFTSNLQNPTTTTPGTYIVTVTDNSNGCTATAQATVNQNTTPPTASATVPGNLNCNTSSLQLNGTGSSQGPNFTYLWTTTNGNIVSGANILTPTVNAAGSYTLQVNNTSNGCTSTTSVTVNQSTPVIASVGNIVNVGCNGGSNGAATAAGNGGSGNYTFLWSTGANTATAGNLPAGTYIVTVTDSENCTSTASATISQPAVLAANATATGETGAGANDGTATAVPSGGTPNYTYLWSNNGTTPAISGLAPGNYTVTITDANNCTAVQTVTVNSFNCTITANISFTNISCNGANNGTATVNLNGASLPATYLWSNGNTTPTVTNLAPGTYTVEVTDANNCEVEASVTISQPPQLLANASSTNQSSVGVNDGTATAQPTGGTPSYTFAWSNNATTQTITGLAPGSYTVTVTDANSCTAIQTVVVSPFNCALTANVSTVNVSCAGNNNGQATAVPGGTTQSVTFAWSTGATTGTITNLSAGIYTVTISDAAGCIAISTATITEPAPLVATIGAVNHVECPEDQDGSVIVSTSGGTAPYTVNWPGGSGGQNLGVGTYTFTVTDANACTTTQSVAINAFDTIPPGITCLPLTSAVCPNIPVQYPLPLVSDNCNLNNAQPVLISGLPSGSVFPPGETVQVFRVTDVSGNSSTCSFTIVAEPPVTIDLVEKNPDVNNAGVGSINVAVGGGAGLLTFAWTKDGQPFANTEDLSGLQQGTYILTVTTAAGCTATSGPIEIGNTVNTGEPGQQLSVRVFPNPVRKTMRLEMQGIQPVDIRILDMHGRLIRILEPAEWTTEIDVSTLPQGMYNLNLLSEKGFWKVVKWIKAE